jgi:hypothetical protein
VLSAHRVSVPRPAQVLTANGFATEALVVRAEGHETVSQESGCEAALDQPSWSEGDANEPPAAFAFAGPEDGSEEGSEEEGEVEEAAAAAAGDEAAAASAAGGDDDGVGGQPLVVAVSPAAWVHVGGREVLRRPTTLAVPATEAANAEASAEVSVGGAADEDEDGTEYPLAAVLLPEPFPGTFAALRRPPRRLPPLAPENTRLEAASLPSLASVESALPRTAVLYREPIAANRGGGAEAKSASRGGAAPPCPGTLALLAAMGGRFGGVASGGRGLELWTHGGAHDRVARAAKVAVLPGSASMPRWVGGGGGGDDCDGGDDDGSDGAWEVEFEVEGPLPAAWAAPGSASTPPSPSPAASAAADAAATDRSFRAAGSGGAAAVGSVALGLGVRGACWAAPLFVPDRDPSPHGAAEVPRGLFPAPLPPGADGDLVLRRFTFLGRLFGKVWGFFAGFGLRLGLVNKKLPPL